MLSLRPLTSSRMVAAILQRRGLIGDGRALGERARQAGGQQRMREKTGGVQRVPEIVIAFNGVGHGGFAGLARASWCRAPARPESRRRGCARAPPSRLLLGRRDADRDGPRRAPAPQAEPWRLACRPASTDSARVSPPVTLQHARHRCASGSARRSSRSSGTDGRPPPALPAGWASRRAHAVLEQGVTDRW